jgi:hypothetical protein
MRSEAWDQDSWQIWPCGQQPEIDALCSLAAYRMEQLGKPELVRFFADLLFCYAPWAYNLPASERNHHARQWGLLIHSLEAVERAVTVGLGSSPGLSLDWARTTIALTLYHDAGRLLDLQLTDASGRIWDPFQGSLLSFCRGTRVTYRWLPGRGLDRHELQSPKLFRAFLPDIARPLLPLLDQAWNAYLFRDRLPPDILGFTPVCVAGIVAWADQRSAEDDRFARKKAARQAPKAAAEAPVCYDASPGRSRTEGP